MVVAARTAKQYSAAAEIGYSLPGSTVYDAYPLVGTSAAARVIGPGDQRDTQPLLDASHPSVNFTLRVSARAAALLVMTRCLTCMNEGCWRMPVENVQTKLHDPYVMSEGQNSISSYPWHCPYSIATEPEQLDL